MTGLWLPLGFRVYPTVGGYRHWRDWRAIRTGWPMLYGQGESPVAALLDLILVRLIK